MLHEEFERLNYQERRDAIRSIDAATIEGRELANYVMTQCRGDDVTELVTNVQSLNEDDLVIIFKRFSFESSAFNNDLAKALVAHHSFNLSVLNRILNEKRKYGRLKNRICVLAAKSTEDEAIYNALYSLDKKSIFNAARKNPHFVFQEPENEDVKVILFLLEHGNISEDTGIEMIDRFNLPASCIKAMLKEKPKWREHILESNKLNFENPSDQLIFAEDKETDEETLLYLSRVAKNEEVRKAILAHHRCTIEMVRNMFSK